MPSFSLLSSPRHAWRSSGLRWPSASNRFRITDRLLHDLIWPSQQRWARLPQQSGVGAAHRWSATLALDVVLSVRNRHSRRWADHGQVWMRDVGSYRTQDPAGSGPLRLRTPHSTVDLLRGLRRTREFPQRMRREPLSDSVGRVSERRASNNRAGLNGQRMLSKRNLKDERNYGVV